MKEFVMDMGEFNRNNSMVWYGLHLCPACNIEESCEILHELFRLHNEHDVVIVVPNCPKFIPKLKENSE